MTQELYNTIVGGVLFLSMLVLAGAILFSLIRAILGPRLTDRLVGVNMIGIKTILLIMIVGVYLDEAYVIDVALIFALLSFFAVVVLTQFVSQFKKYQRHNPSSLPEKGVNLNDADH